MGHMKGRACLLKVNTGTEEAPVWTVVAGQRGGSIERSVENIDVSSKDEDYRKIELTYLTWSFSADGLYKMTDDGFAKLEEAFNNKEKVKVQIALVDNTYTGEGYITELSFDLGYEDCVTYSCSIEGSGALVKSESEA